MTEEIEDALYSACAVTTRLVPRMGGVVIPNHPRAVGTFYAYRVDTHSHKC